MGFVTFNRYILSIIFGFLTLSMIAQEEQSYQLSEVIFSGLYKTNEMVARRLLSAKIGDRMDLNMIKQDAQRLKNFPGVDNVKYSIDTIDSNIKIIYQVDEIRTLLPIMNFGGIEGNVWYQIGFTDINWLGKGNQLSAYYQNSDRRHSGAIYYRVPRVAMSNWGYAINVSRWASQEPLFFEDDVTVQYNFDFNNIGVTGIYQFSNRRRVEFGGSYFVEKYQKLLSESGESLPGPNQLSQPKILGKLNYVEDFINYHSYQQQGYAWQAIYQNVITLDAPNPFNSLILQYRYYKMLPSKINIAIRTRFGISTNNNSPFAPFVIDSHVNLRGVGNRIDRGTAQLIFNAEIRKAVFETNLWAGQVVAFTDLGSWRDPGGALRDLLEANDFRHFIGGGVRLIYKKIFGAILRIDYGIDIYHPEENGIVIGFGQYF